MSNLTPAARVAVETIKAALESLDEADREAVTRALNVYIRPVPMIPPGPDLDSRPSVEPPKDTVPFLAPPRPPSP